MDIRICLWNWADYNEGVASWQWFTLPKEREAMDQWIDTMEAERKEELFICDSDHRFIDEHTNSKAILALANQSISDLIDLAEQDVPFGIELLNEILADYTPTEIVNMVQFGHYSPNDSYFIFDGYNNIKTLSSEEYNQYMIEIIEEGAQLFLDNY